jgi:phosphonate transport system ATP-binding protein
LEKVQSKVAMIYQDFCLVNASTCWQNVLNGCLMRVPFWRVIWGKFPNQEKTKALAALKQVGLEKYALEQVAALSGGQKQRVAIARALQQEAAVILADEPVASVDPLTAEQILNILKRLQQEQGLTIVMNSHSVEQAKKYAQRIIGLKNGAIFLDKAAEDWTKEDFRLLYEDGSHE